MAKFSRLCKFCLKFSVRLAEVGKDSDVVQGQVGGLGNRWVPRLAMLGAVLAWLWPIGLGGQMPVGGDATQFSMGLMAFLKASIRAGRLPIWNDLWGFGFPGLAESQMGVFYPPHWLLFGCFSTETATVASLVLHSLWGALGANWAARRFGCSEIAAALAGFTWATCGFYEIHLPHQWAGSVGSWMPWAWCLAWQISRGEGSRRTPWLLAAVLALQVLPGHFQLAFVTEVGCLALAMVASERSVSRRLALVLAILGMIPLAAAQLWPTLRLASLSDSRRDFEYLSGFAASPIHFISYVAPGLFHRSPLWRPVVWDPFHTSPEELLHYVGLIPLFLAIGAMIRGFRADPAVRALAVLVGLTVFLSLGPYAPGFEWLIKLPGFSFFRAAGRWGLATSLAMAILAGRGFDLLATWPRVGRSVRRFVLTCFVSLGLVVLGLELALAGSSGESWKPVASAFEQVGRLSPWAGRPGERTFRDVMATARQHRSDVRFQIGYARTDGRLPPSRGISLDLQRFRLYARELGEAVALLVTLLVVSRWASRPRTFAAALLMISFADSLILARHRHYDLGPARPLIEQSPMLRRLSQEPRGTRSLDPGQNLLMMVGVDGVLAYRTLDLPSPFGLVQMIQGRVAGAQATEPMRVAGVDLRLLDPLENQNLPDDVLHPYWDQVETIRDPALAGWVTGTEFVRASGLTDFRLVRLKVPATRAWLLPSSELEKVDGMVNPRLLIEKFRGAKPLAFRSDVPERAEVDLSIADRTSSMVVLSVTFDPEWQAWWTSPEGDRRPARVEKVLGGWQGVTAPEPGRWTLHLDYPGQAVRVGIGVSVVAWVLWALIYWRVGRESSRPGRENDREDGAGDRGGFGIRLPGTDPDLAQPPGGEDRDGDLEVG